jgi:hypothetical protein
MSSIHAKEGNCSSYFIANVFKEKKMVDGVVNCIILLICKFFITTYGQFNVLNHNCDHKFNFTCIDTIGHIVSVEKNPIKKTDQNGRKMDY